MIDHSTMVEALIKKGVDIQKQLTPGRCELIHDCIGIASEAGELLDAIKKHTIYNQPLDRKNLIEELGDLEFYLEALRLHTSITRGECLLANIAKLSKRYEGFKYSDAAAKERKDKLFESKNH